MAKRFLASSGEPSELGGVGAAGPREVVEEHRPGYRGRIGHCAVEGEELGELAGGAHPLGQGAQRIGTVVEDAHGFVQMETCFGGRRVVDWLSGEQLPRIC